MVASSACIKKAAAAMAGSPTSLCKEKVITYAALSSQFALWVSDGPEICSLSFVSLYIARKDVAFKLFREVSVAPFLSLPFFFRRGWCLRNAPFSPLNIGMARSRSAVRRRREGPFA